MENKERIVGLSKLRYELIINEALDQSLAEKNSQKIDEYANEIRKLLKENFESLEFEFIFEQLSCLGEAPNLLYDDDGHWTVTSDGFQSVTANGPDDWEGTFFVKKEDWKNTPREALKQYLFEE